jgi:NAD(P)-dependent dehydrogenase (short-subunit alcohol dehydrogenase family)
LNLRRLNKPLFYFGLQAYRVSKLANVLFTYELNRRLKDTSVRAFAVDPGLVNTEIGMKQTSGLTYFVWNDRRRKGTQPEVPAKTIAFLSREKSLQDEKHYYWRDCRPKQPSRQAQREDLAKDLWEVTAKMCGIV